MPTRIAAGGQSRYAIYCPAWAAEPVRFAAAELRRYLAALSGAELPIVEAFEGIDPLSLALAPHGVWPARRPRLAPAPPDDSFVVEAGELPGGLLGGGEADGVVWLRGQNARGALYAAYALLETLGCRWILPGDEVVPRLAELVVPDLALSESPAFAHRDFAEDARHVPVRDPTWLAAQVRDDLALIDWLGKRRVNLLSTFLVEASEPAAELHAAMRQRGVETFGGGHIIPELLPRGLFAQHPEYFRQAPDGQRRADGNLCVSSPGAIAVLREQTVATGRRLRALGVPVNMLNVWGEDVRGGGWCSCPDCRRLTPQDQYITACNHVVAALREAGIGLQVDCIAYYDTLEPDLTAVRPDAELHLNFAPRLRCYRHAIDDPTCEVNAWHRRNLELWLRHFAGSQLDVFEYWGDCILFRSFAIPLTRVIQGDLHYYRSLGSQRAMFLIMGAYCHLAHPLNYVTFAHLAWNPAADLEAILDDYCRAAYGPAAAAMRRFFAELEDAVGAALGHGDVTSPPLAHDPLAERRIADLRLGVRQIDELGPRLAEAEALAATPEQRRRVRDALWAWRFTAVELRALYHQVRGQYHLSYARGMALSNAVARQPDGRYRRYDFTAPAASRYVLTDEPPYPARGYEEAAEEFERAINLYAAGARLLTEELPAELRTSWVATGFGFGRQHEVLVRRQELWREECRQRE